MNSTQRIASDARYIVASIALVTSMAVFASLGSMHARQQPISEFGPSLASGVVVTPYLSGDCTCGAPDVGNAAVDLSDADRAAADTQSRQTEIQVNIQPQLDNGGSISTYNSGENLTVFTSISSQK